MAEYRKMGKYAKSIKKYKRERGRRKQVLAFADAGLSQKDIADKLDVSTKTVGRDLKKLGSYIKKVSRQSTPKVEVCLNEALSKFPTVDRYRFVGRALGESKDVARALRSTTHDHRPVAGSRPKMDRARLSALDCDVVFPKDFLSQTPIGIARAFYAFVYRSLKNRWKLEKKMTFDKRHKAKTRAFKWFEARKDKLEPEIAGLPLPFSAR